MANLFPWPFQLLEAVCIPWLTTPPPPFSIFKASSISSFWPFFLLFLMISPSDHGQKGPKWYHLAKLRGFKTVSFPQLSILDSYICKDPLAEEMNIFIGSGDKDVDGCGGGYHAASCQWQMCDTQLSPASPRSHGLFLFLRTVSSFFAYLCFLFQA